MRRRTALAILAAVAVVTAALAAAAVGPPLPGEQRLRSSLGLGGGFEPCRPGAERVLYPLDEGPTGKRWETVPSLPLAQDEFRAAALDGTIYVGSGLREGDGDLLLESTGVFFAFDPRRRAFRRLSDLPRRVDHPALAPHAGDLYLVGGWKDGVPTAEAWRYSPRSGRWSTIAPMPSARAAAAAAVVDDRLYVVGGSTQEHFGVDHAGSTLVEVYDLETGRWTRGPDMPTPRHHHAAFALGGMLYAVGGRSHEDMSLDAVERLDPEGGAWAGLPPLPLGAGGLGAAVAGGRAVVVGGGDDAEGWVTPAAWSLEAEEGSWRRLPDLGVARHGHGVAAVGDLVFVFGGAPCPGWGETASVESLQLP